MNKIKNIYLKISLVFLVLSISSCFKWETFINLDDIPKDKVEELINSPSEISFENKIFIFYSIFVDGKHLPRKKYFSINIRYIFDYSSKNKAFSENFKILEFYVINKKRNFYFQFNFPTNDNENYINDIPNNYIEDTEDIFIIKMEDKMKKAYFLRSKTKNEEIELEKKVSDYYKKGAIK